MGRPVWLKGGKGRLDWQKRIGFCANTGYYYLKYLFALVPTPPAPWSGGRANLRTPE